MDKITGYDEDGQPLGSKGRIIQARVKSTVVMGAQHKLLIPEDELHEAITKYLHNNPPIPAQSSAWDVAEQIVKSLSHFRYP